MDTKSKWALTGLIVAGVVLWWLSNNVTPEGSRWLSQTVMVLMGLGFIGWVGYLAATANRKG